MTDPINTSGNLPGRSLTGSINNGANRTSSRVNAEDDGTAPSANTPPNSDSVDTVSLSAGSQQVIELQQQLKTAPEIDGAKIEAIRQEIANGNYPLDADKIAENFINLEQSLIE